MIETETEHISLEEMQLVNRPTRDHHTAGDHCDLYLILTQL